MISIVGWMSIRLRRFRAKKFLTKMKIDRVVCVLHVAYYFIFHLVIFMTPAQMSSVSPNPVRKAHFLDLIYYFQKYRTIAFFSILGMSIFEVLDLFVPYGIGQLLNLLSGHPIDSPLQTVISTIAKVINQPITQVFSLSVIAGLIGLLSINSPDSF